MERQEERKRSLGSPRALGSRVDRNRPKGIFFLGMLLAIGVGIPFVHAEEKEGENMATIDALVKEIVWTGQASIRIQHGGKTIWIDPFQVGLSYANPKADLVFITHEHDDHCDQDSLRTVVGEKTVVILPATVKTKWDRWGIRCRETKTVKPGESLGVEGIAVQTISAYNTQKRFHPKSSAWCGYLLTVDGVKIYHTGDTNRIPEMKELKCDIVLLPLGQTYTMDSVEEAAEVARDVQAKVAIPIHYGMYEGSVADATRFQKILETSSSIRVVILPRSGS